MDANKIIAIGSVDKHCCFNRFINCENNKCATCGWNPEVSVKRVKQWCMDRAMNKC